MNNNLLFSNTEERQEIISIKELKKIFNDSLFYFGVFLTAFILLQFFPYISGIFQDFTIGINEVLVSTLGFANVLFIQLFNKIFCKNN